MTSDKNLAYWENGRVSLVVGNLVEQTVDAIVNAANSTLLGGGGVDGAIHMAGGPAILAACRALRSTVYPNGLPTGQAVLTTAGRLPAKAVIHTVGPIYGNENGRESLLLADSYRNTLQLAADHGLTSVAFPAISTGAYGFPEPDAARVASRAIRDFLKTDNVLVEVRLVFYRPAALAVFSRHHVFQMS